MNNSVKQIGPMVLLIISAFGCSEGSDPNNSGSSEWSIPSAEVFDGGPGKDGIPALNNPTMISANEASYLSDNDLVLGYKVGNDVRAYPHVILDWHEIINDEVGGKAIAMIYCPLTGTGTLWDRTINGTVTTFGVSGLLYNSNIIPYDRLTNSNWSQIRLDCVNGSLRGTAAETFHTVETTWKTWRTMFPDTKVVSINTGFSRNYGSYPYGDYRTNHSRFIFPYTPEDNRIPNKERVLGVLIDGKPRVFRLGSFSDGIKVEEETFNGTELVIVGSEEHKFLTAFERHAEDGTLLSFEVSAPTISSVVLQDNEGNAWNVFGEAVSGPRTGQKLKTVVSFIGYWFSWGAFYPQAEIADPM